MQKIMEKWEHAIAVLESIQTGIISLNSAIVKETRRSKLPDFVHVPFKGAEIYLLHKAFIDSGGAANENYKSLLEKTVCRISNKTQRGFSPQSFCKFSDKVDPESKENVKRFLQKMIRNIDSYD
jgi:hypothetical protein